jgi:pimeloyl-ACP methyl ester carboxylesterase
VSLTALEASELFRRPPDRHVTVRDGAEAAVRSVGTGPDVLFVHGWPVSGATFRSLLPHLVDHVTCHVLDMPGAGSSRYTAATPLSIDLHIESVRAAIDQLGLDRVAVVGHDSGGMIARHAVAGDPRLRAMGLIDTEQPSGLSWRFKSFLLARHSPGLAAGLGWVSGRRRLRRSQLVFGGAFHDTNLLDGEFDEFFLAPLNRSAERRNAAAQLLRSLERHHLDELGALHTRIDVPVQLVWGEHDVFFPLAWARTMVETFRDARLEIIGDAGLFSHEERPEAVARALLPTITAVA